MREAGEMDDREQGTRSPMTRREFFVRVGNGAVGVTLLGGGGVCGSYLWPNVVLEPQARFRAVSLQEIPPGACVFDSRYRVFIFREKEGFLYAVSAVCTHLGCTANWKPEGVPNHPSGVIACPCHGSVFSKRGEVLHGPAPRPLDRFRMTLEDGELFVDTSEKVGEEDMILRV